MGGIGFSPYMGALDIDLDATVHHKMEAAVFYIPVGVFWSSVQRSCVRSSKSEK